MLIIFVPIAKFVHFVAKTKTKPKPKKCFFANYDKLVRLPTYLYYECLLSLDVSVKIKPFESCLGCWLAAIAAAG